MDDCGLVDALSAAVPASTALTSPGGGTLSYRELIEQAAAIAGQLATAAAVPGDRIGILLPNGPGMAVTLIAAMGWYCAAPLNPRLLPAELAASIQDLQVRAVVSGDATIELPPGIRRLVLSEGNGRWTLHGLATGTTPTVGRGAAEALVLQTSGTTARPKTVPLTHQNLAASARNIIETLALSPDDRSLAVMPLFHIHGIVASLLAPLFAGGSVACPPNFDPFRFHDWLAELQPTWFSAVPTMHRLIVNRARGTLSNSRLRFMRSSSSALPPSLLVRAEAAFGVPLVEAYGMTEAAHQVTSNPLPPEERRPGSVGRAVGLEVRILGDGSRGEVAIRGANVMSSYAGNPVANADAFVDDWFRTGDEGVLDADGYLSLTGRLKELINRGGEKIAPREVEEALLLHPAVTDAVVFAVPHAGLGEEPGAAVVASGSVTAAALRVFLLERLSPFKVPRRIVLVESIPLGPTGKVQRLGMAERLGFSD